MLSSRELPVSTHLNESETPMKINSRFAKTTVAAALVLSSGAATLGITSFVSAEMQNPEGTAIVASTATVAEEQSGVVAVTYPFEADSTDETAIVVESNVSSNAVATTGEDTSTPAKRRSPVAVAASALGITEAELVTELQAGKSIADVATAKGVAIDTVVDALYADLKAHIDAHVAAGDITQEQADARLADAKTRITGMVNMAGPLRGKGPGGHGDRMGHRGGPRFVTESLAKALGMTVDELKAEIKSGKTLVQIASDKNVSLETVKDQLLADYTAKEQAEVAEGKHTQDEVDAKIAEFKTRLDDIVNGVRPMKGPDGRGDHRGMGGRGDHRGMGGHGRDHADN